MLIAGSLSSQRAGARHTDIYKKLIILITFIHAFKCQGCVSNKSYLDFACVMHAVCVIDFDAYLLYLIDFAAYLVCVLDCAVYLGSRTRALRASLIASGSAPVCLILHDVCCHFRRRFSTSPRAGTLQTGSCRASHSTRIIVMHASRWQGFMLF